MTDRLKGVVVSFSRDIRVDDAEHVMSAIRMLRDVADVSPLVATYEDDLARMRVKDELWAKIKDAFWGERKPR